MNPKKKYFNKKGIFFTFLSLTITAAMIIFFSPSTSLNIAVDFPSVKTRVQTVDGFVKDLENSYFKNILKISSKKGFLALISNMESNNEFYSDIQSSYFEVVTQGTIGGVQISSMQGNTLDNWLARMSNISKNTLNVMTNFTVNNVEISQVRPWFVDLKLNISFSLVSETSAWNVSGYIAKSELEISNFDDPYYFLNSDGNTVNIINRTNITQGQWNFERVKNHIRHGTYVHFSNSRAPSFLMRFTNTSLNSSCCGIESLVNPTNLLMPNHMESYADFLFFNHSYQNKCSELFNITDTSFKSEFPHFKLNFNKILLYNISLSEITSSC